MIVKKCRVIKNEILCMGIHAITIEFGKETSVCTPGQFVHVKCNNSYYPLLRRPISIASIDKDKGTILLVIQVKGEGTEIICGIKPGELLDVLGPLGNGFNLDESIIKTAYLVGGGIGIAPLLFTSEYYNNINFIAFLGFRNSQVMMLEEGFKDKCKSVYICTEDGSCGEKGLVTDIMKADAKNNKPQIILCCGPTPMMASVKKIANQYEIPCFVSLEENMGCGIGACLTCSCKVKSDIDEDGYDYSKVCDDGPIFNANEVIFDE